VEGQTSGAETFSKAGGDLGGAVSAVVDDRPHDGGADDRAIGIAEHLTHLLGGGNANADVNALRTGGLEPRDEPPGCGVDTLAGAGDPHRRDRVDPTAARLDDHPETLVGRTWRGEEDPVEPR